MRIDELVAELDEQDLVDVMTFEAIERRIVGCLRDQLLSKNGFSIESLKEVILVTVETDTGQDRSLLSME